MRRQAQILKCDVCLMMVETDGEGVPVAWVQLHARAGNGTELGTVDVCHRCWRVSRVELLVEAAKQRAKEEGSDE